MASLERSEALGHFPAAVPAAALDAEIEMRWNRWVARGRVHEQRARRRFVVWASVLATAAAVAYAFLR